MDSQWPRYEVFKQDAPGAPVQNVGSVHAPDAGLALLEARNVHGRRPSAVSMWVAPVSAITSRTHEELANRVDGSDDESHSMVAQVAYAIFRKTGHRRSMTFVQFVGSVLAISGRQAIRDALTKWPASDAMVWWACPESAISRTERADAPSWFEPAKDKVYRQQSHYTNAHGQPVGRRAQP